jgi:DNA invertase Pin-like site-specific DNA recombinase
VIIGYARVSKAEQNLDMQVDALRAAGCEKIFSDKQSGAKWERKELQNAMSHLRAGDTLVVWKLDRLGRSVIQSVKLLSEFAAAKVEFRSLTEDIDTGTPMGKFYFHMAAALAELERDRIIERTRTGLKAARERGRVGGRKPALSAEQQATAIEMLREGGRKMSEVARLLDVSAPTISRVAARAGLTLATIGAEAKPRGRRGGRQRALSPEREALALDMLRDGTKSQADVARILKVSPPTISRLVERVGGSAPLAEAAD